MKAKVKKISLIGLLFGIIFSHPSFASELLDYVHPFIGASLGLSVNLYDTDIAERYGVEYSTFGSSHYSSFSYGFNAGMKFLKDTNIYHPGIQAFYDMILDTVKVDVAMGYGETLTFTGDATHQLIGAEFDNYIRLAHNSSLAGYKCDSFFVFGLDAGKIKSKYELTSDTLSEDGAFYGVKLESLTEFRDGAGFSINIRWLRTNTEAVSSILSSRIGLRYTF